MTREATFQTAGMSGAYDFVCPFGATDMCSNALCMCGLHCEPAIPEGAQPGKVLVAYVVPPDGEVPSIEELKGRLEAFSASSPGTAFELILAVSHKGSRDRVWEPIAPGMVRIDADYHVKPTLAGSSMIGCDYRVLAYIFAGLQTKGSGGACHKPESAAKSLFGAADSNGWHRKGNCPLLGSIRLIRFKVRKNAGEDIPLHSRETLVKAFRMGRSVWAVVRQHGLLDVSQVPRLSETNVLVRVKHAFARITHSLVLFLWGLTVKRRKFGHFLLLGYNCETAFRFLMANGFLDATFFAWSGSWTCDVTLDALRRFDSLFTGDMLFTGDGDLFIDVATGLSMHSRHKAVSGSSAVAEDLEEEKAELRSRAAHLREKFYRQLRDDESTLAVIKLSPSDCPKGDEYAHLLLEQMKAMGGKNLSLLVVCQEEDAVWFPSAHPDYEVRTVREFSPDWNAASEIDGDRLGWMKIWREFAPARKIVQHKTYKFQRKGA